MTHPLTAAALAALLAASLTSVHGQATPSAGAASAATSPPPDMSRSTPGPIVTLPATPASSIVLLPAPAKRALVPRTGSATPSGISGTSGVGNYSGGKSNGINDGNDAARGSNGAAGTIAAPQGAKPLQPREKLPPRSGA